MIEHVSISDEERRLITAFALQRLETARITMDLTQPRANLSQKSL